MAHEHILKIPGAFTAFVAEYIYRFHIRGILFGLGLSLFNMSEKIKKPIIALLWVLIYTFVWTGPLNAESGVSVGVGGLFGDKAVLIVNGKRHVVAVGETIMENVKLIAIDGEQVTLDVGGQRRTQRLGDNFAISTQFVTPEHSEVVIAQNNNGMFVTVGSINGFPVTFLVDTGANTVALNEPNAKRLQIDYQAQGEPTFVRTASSIVKAYRVRLRSVSVGDIKLNNVVAVVMSGQYPQEILLGMSFLGSLEIERSGQLMTLRKSW